MRRALTFLFAVIIAALALVGCNSVKTDYASPKEVIEAHEAIHTEWENNQLYDDLEGKTFKIKANADLDKSNTKGDTEIAKKAEIRCFAPGARREMHHPRHRIRFGTGLLPTFQEG